jgi:hypothetical protein
MGTAVSCAGCRHFMNKPAALEAALPGLSTLSSAYSAVRAEDGLCALHDRYLGADSLCPSHQPWIPSAVDPVR